ATEILTSAGRELAVTACAALDRLFPAGEPVPVSYTGNVFGAGPVLFDAFAAELAARRPEAELREPDGDGLRGAAVLAELAPTLPPEPGVLWRRP
ncbi:MAG TPA: hypothetical protein VFR97_08375, partial [Capillimicrobium sp.]|nr:hypothetical protein [Capillimicrobium sp.]